MQATNSSLTLTSTTAVNVVNVDTPQPVQPPSPDGSGARMDNRQAPADPRGHDDSAIDNCASEEASSEPSYEVRHFPNESDSTDDVIIIDGKKPVATEATQALQDALVDADLDRLKDLLADRPALINQPIALLKCTPLVAAIEIKRADIIDYLLALPGIDLDARGSSGQTPLHAACYSGNVALAMRLLRCGAKVNTCDGNSTPLITASKLGDRALLKKILKRTSKILLDFRSSSGHTAVTAAIDAGQLGAVKLLLRKGASPNQQSVRGMTPLHHAAKLGHTQIAKLLIKHGAIQEWTGAGMPANMACSGNHAATLAYLLKKLDTEQKVFAGVWMSYAVLESVVNDATDCIEILLRAGVGMLPETGAFSLLMGVVQLDKPRAVEILLRHGADPTYLTKTGNSALAVAIKHEVSMDLLLILLSAMGQRITLAHDVALKLVQRARDEQDFRILNELAIRRIEDLLGKRFDLKKALNE